MVLGIPADLLLIGAAIALFFVVIVMVGSSIALLSPEQLAQFRSEKLYSGWYMAAVAGLFVLMAYLEDLRLIAAAGITAIACTIYEHWKNARNLEHLDVPEPFRKRIAVAAWLGNAIVALVVAGSLAGAGCCYGYERAPADFDLTGVWREVPYGGTLRFDRSEGDWRGVYVTVTDNQRDEYGFQAGETAMRGRVADGVFVGEILLKYSRELRSECKDLAASYWAAVRMRFRDNFSEFTGRWRQDYIVVDPCTKIPFVWKEYTLRREKN